MFKMYPSFVLTLLLTLITCLAVSQVAMVQDILPGQEGSSPENFTEYHGRVLYEGSLYFTTDGEEGKELWRYHSQTGAVLVAPLGAEEVDIVFTYQDRLFINVYKYGNLNNFTLLSYHPFIGIVVEEEQSLDFQGKPIIYDDTLYFNGDDTSPNWEELHRYHPSMGFELMEIRTKRDATFPRGFTKYQGSLYFSALGEKVYFYLPDGSYYDGGGLFRYSSTTGKLERITNFSNAPFGITQPRGLTLLDDTLYFVASDHIHGPELWRYHPSTGAKMVADIHYQPGDPYAQNSIREITKYQGALYFSADDAIHGGELWRYVPGVGAKMVADINQTLDQRGPSSHSVDRGSRISGITEYQGTLYFTADDGIHGYELWRYHPSTGASMVADIFPGSEGSRPDRFQIYRDELIFIADDGTHGRELWRYHPSSGVQLIADINSRGSDDNGSPFYYGPSRFIEYAGSLFFSVDDGAHGRELWKYQTIPCQTFLCRILNDDSGITARADIDLGFDYFQAEYVLVADEEEEEEQDDTAPWLLSLESEEGELLWGESFSIPNELMIPDVDMYSGSLVLSSGTEKESQPLMKLNANLVSAGVKQVSFSTDPVEQMFSLYVETNKDVSVPLLLSLQDESGEVTWQHLLEAPYHGVVEELTKQTGSTLLISVAENRRTESYDKGTTQSLTDISEAGSLGSSAIQIYPNPVIDHTLHLNIASPAAGQANVQVLNLMGQQVLQRELSTQAGQQRLSVDMQGIPKGAYILKVQQGPQQTTTRLLVAE